MCMACTPNLFFIHQGKCCCYSKGNIEVVPNNYKSSPTDRSGNLDKPLLPEVFDFLDRCCVQQGKSGVVQNIKLLSGTCKQANSGNEYLKQ